MSAARRPGSAPADAGARAGGRDERGTALRRARLVLRRALRPADPLPVAVLAAYVLAFVTWDVAAPLDDPALNVLSNAGSLLAGLGAVAVCWRTARDARLPPPLKRAWRWLCWSLTVFLGGDALFLLEKVLRSGGVVGGSSADVAYLASYPLALMAVISLRGRNAEPVGRAAFLLDATMVTLGGAMVAWQVFVQPTFAGRRDAEILAAVAYVLCDLSVLLVLLIGSLRPGAVPHARIALPGLAFGIRLWANALFWLDVLRGEPSRLGAVASGLYNVAWVAFALAAWSQARAVRDQMPSSAERAPSSLRPVSLVPTGAAALGLIVLFQAVFTRLSLDVGLLLAVGVALTAAALARQLVAVRAAARLAAERAARANEARFRSLVQNASEIVLVIDEDGRVRYHTPSAERFLAGGEGALDGVPLAALTHPEDGALAEGLVRDACRSPRSTPKAEWRMRWSDGSWHYVEARAKSVPDDPNLGGVILTLRSIHEHKALEERLAHQAFHDPLTHLANRMLLADRLEHALARARRGGDPVTVLFIDLDEFKDVNDSLGHATGDQLLTELARRLLGCVRSADTAARLGGDEFAVLVEEGGGLEAARQVAARVSQAVQRPFLVAGREVLLGASIGIASSEHGVQTAGDLLRNADVAMYCAKRAGKGKVVVFEESMQAAVRERLELEEELRGVLDRHELALVYQPIVALGNGRIVGAEALLRWEHPARGRLNPPAFIPAAQATGLMPEIARWTIEQACRCAANWPAVEGHGEPLLSINVAPSLLVGQGFVQQVEQAAADARLAPGRLVLELTDGAAVEDASGSRAAMRALQQLGMRIAIDDFGTGFSSLSSLRDMPVDILKLDRLFAKGIADDPQAAMLARGILDLARALGKTVIAEGIEDESQARRLHELGCPMGQGFYYSPPVEAGALFQGGKGAGKPRPGGPEIAGAMG